MEEFEEETSKLPLLFYMIAKKSYKKIIFCHNGRWWSLLEKVKPILDKMNVEYLDLMQKDYFEEIKTNYFKGNSGLTKSRVISILPTKQRFASFFPGVNPNIFQGVPKKS